MYKFVIDNQYLTSIPVQYEYTDVNGVEIKTTTNVDHPSFTALREHLGYDGLISIERGWWNGDIVLKDFMLNGVVLKSNEKFVCAGAMKYQLRK